MIHDVAVIGGGIHGAGVAQAAAAAGHTVLVLEAGQWAGGTSGASSKLIHGGLRYLESGNLALVRESLGERRLLHRLAPELVHYQRFYIPLYADSQRRPWQLQLGLGLYALLAGPGQHARFHRLPPAADAWPGLRHQGLRAVFQYWDAQTDDRAMTLAVLASARRLGARLLAETPVEAIQRREDLWQLHTPAGRFQARAVVNAAGPWVNRVSALAGDRVPRRASSHVQGSHLILAEPLPLPGAWYLEAADRRAVFALPWQNGTLLGTTEVDVDEPRFGVHPEVTAAEETYLLATLARYWPALQPRVAGRFAGIRVLPASDDSPFRRSRDVALVADHPQRPAWISIYGGKLTTWRLTAGQVMERLVPRLGPRPPRADTARLMLPPATEEEQARLSG